MFCNVIRVKGKIYLNEKVNMVWCDNEEYDIETRPEVYSSASSISFSDIQSVKQSTYYSLEDTAIWPKLTPRGGVEYNRNQNYKALTRNLPGIRYHVSVHGSSYFKLPGSCFKHFGVSWYDQEYMALFLV